MHSSQLSLEDVDMAMQTLQVQPSQAIRPIFDVMVERQPDVFTIVQQIRLCRLKLGSVLNRLENFEPGPEALESLRDCSDDVTHEVRVLVETLQRLMGH
jgi:hypothetical protein